MPQDDPNIVDAEFRPLAPSRVERVRRWFDVLGYINSQGALLFGRHLRIQVGWLVLLLFGAWFAGLIFAGIVVNGDYQQLRRQLEAARAQAAASSAQPRPVSSPAAVPASPN